MTKATLGILAAVAIIGITGVVIIQRQTHIRLGADRELQQQLARMRLSADNEHLSNLVVQSRIAQASAHEQLQELAKLRAEVNQLRLERQTNQTDWALLVQSVSNQVGELSALRSDLNALGEEIVETRDVIEELYTAVPVIDPEEPPAEPTVTSSQDQTMSVRIIHTHADFAEKLKRSVNADEDETFQEVFGRFLLGHGLDLGGVARLVFDERTGRIIVRAPEPTLDSIEKLTVGLDGAE